MSPQPQVGVPDVQLWLLRGQLRVASARVPATEVLHSPRGPSACGRLCGRVLSLFLVRAPVSPCVPLCPFVSLCIPSVSLHILLCPSVSPLCPSVSHCVLPLSPVSFCVPLCPSVSPCVPPCPLSVPTMSLLHVPSLFPPHLLQVPSISAPCPLSVPSTPPRVPWLSPRVSPVSPR